MIPFMKIKTILLVPILLTGCVASFVKGDHDLIDEDYPDITSVPSREIADADRGHHAQSEGISRSYDLDALEKDRVNLDQEAQRLRDRVLRK
jgi:hypothetical protein